MKQKYTDGKWEIDNTLGYPMAVDEKGNCIASTGGGCNLNKKLEPKKLTDEQVENWRKVLILQFGTYACIMPKEEICLYAAKMEKGLNEIKEGVE